MYATNPIQINVILHIISNLRDSLIKMKNRHFENFIYNYMYIPSSPNLSGQMLPYTNYISISLKHYVYTDAKSVCIQALAGEVGMSNELDDVARALFNGQIPNIWRRLAPATLKSLGNWMIHFRNRFSQYDGWVRNYTFTPLVK